MSFKPFGENQLESKMKTQNTSKKDLNTTPRISTRGGRIVKDFSKKKSKDDMKDFSNEDKEKELLMKVADLAVNLEKEVANLRGDMNILASYVRNQVETKIKDNQEHTKAMYDNLNTCMTDLSNATIELVSGVEEEFNKVKAEIQVLNSKFNHFRFNNTGDSGGFDTLSRRIRRLEDNDNIDNIQKQLDNQQEDLNKLKACMEVFSSHINVLEQRNKKFTDRFRFGKFKFKTIQDEELLRTNLKEFHTQKQSFTLNDD